MAGAAKGTRLADSLGRLRLNFPLLMSFIILFAVLVGPVNLFWIAGANRRHRLFWTTPAISIGASLLLLVLIVCEDGFGGEGHRIIVVQLLPAEHKAILTQEQATRTGVLLSRRFDIVDDLFLTPLALNRPAPGDDGQSGHTYEGGWFASRRVQSQLVAAIVPTRAEVQLLNARAAGGGAPPVVTSSIAATLEIIVYTDPQGAFWIGRNLHTGERQTLQPAGPLLPHLGMPEAGGSMLAALSAADGGRRGSFCAQSSSGPFIATLPSIRWSRQEAVYSGPVTVVP